MLARYRRYRSYGHPPFVAALYAPPVEAIVCVAVVIGLIVGWK